MMLTSPFLFRRGFRHSGHSLMLTTRSMLVSVELSGPSDVELARDVKGGLTRPAGSGASTTVPCSGSVSAFVPL